MLATFPLNLYLFFIGKEIASTESIHIGIRMKCHYIFCLALIYIGGDYCVELPDKVKHCVR